MTLQEFINRCGGSFGESGHDLIVNCPLCRENKGKEAHGRVCADGKDGVLFSCMRNSKHKLPEILNLWGVAGKAPSARSARKPAAPRPNAPKADDVVGSSEPKKLGKLVRTYEYTDAHGAYLFEVCRYDPKDFRQRTRRSDGSYSYSVPSDIRNSVLYKLPQVLDAIGKRRLIFAAEGEKDVETLTGEGYIATCIAGGASKSWSENQIQWLSGADVIVLPDNDPRNDEGHCKGQEYAYALCEKLLGTAASVRLVNLAGALDALPPKGDISDWFFILGGDEGRARLDELVRQTVPFYAGYPMFWLNEYEQVCDYIAKVPGYGVMPNGGIGALNGYDDAGKPQFKAITDFVAIPSGIVTLDDGVQQRSDMLISGWTGFGKRLPTATVLQSEYESMSWVTRNWGVDAQVLPGQSNKDKARYVIATAGRGYAKRMTKYVHTGWRKIDGEWCYLYNGGAIGHDGVTVEMLGNMNRYSLDVEPGVTYSLEEACAASYGLKYHMSERMYYAMMSVVYMAPLVEFLGQADLAPGFTLFLHGESGTHKSTSSALALSHFGNFNYQNLPAHFTSTANSIREMCFMAKDVPMVIDDFHPTGDIRKRKQMEDVVDMLSRAYGDRADRLRMNSDLTLRASRPVRGVAIFSGEDYPNIGSSGNARLYTLEVTKSDMPFTDELTEFMEDVRMGILRKAMRGYIRFILNNADALPKLFREEHIRLRDEARRRIKDSGTHDRFAPMVGMMMLALEMMWRYFKSVGLLSDEDIAEERENAWKLLLTEVKTSSDLVKQDEAGEMFLRILGEQIAIGTVYVDDQTGVKPPANVTRVGYADKDYYYLIQDNAFRAVSDVIKAQGFEFPKGMRGVAKELLDKGKIARNEKGRFTIRKRFGDHNLQVMCIRRVDIDGNANDAQERMDFIEIHDDDSLKSPF